MINETKSEIAEKLRKALEEAKEIQESSIAWSTVIAFGHLEVNLEFIIEELEEGEI